MFASKWDYLVGDAGGAVFTLRHGRELKHSLEMPKFNGYGAAEFKQPFYSRTYTSHR